MSYLDELLNMDMVHQDDVPNLQRLREAFMVHDYLHYKTLLQPFFKYSEQNPVFRLPFTDMLKAFLVVRLEAFYERGYEFIPYHDTSFAIYSGGLLMAHFDVLRGFEVHLYKKINDVMKMQDKKETLKLAAAQLKNQVMDTEYLLTAPDDIYKEPFTYIADHYHVNPKEMNRLLKKKDPLFLHAFNQTKSLLRVNEQYLHSLEARFVHVAEYSYALDDLLSRKHYFLELVESYNLALMQ